MLDRTGLVHQFTDMGAHVNTHTDIYTCTRTRTHTHTHTQAHTFAALRAIVNKTSRAIATRRDSIARIRALALAVTAAVVCLARV